MTNLYPGQMRWIAALCEALGTVDNGKDDEGLMLKNGIPVVDEHGHVYGHLGDEVGGAWCFWPGSENPYAKTVKA